MSTEGNQVESENDWLFDIIINFLRSPAWKAPVMSYIDEHCVLFDTEDENKLEYTPIHKVTYLIKEFKKLVDDLLEGLLAELGVAPEQFSDACAKAGENPVHKKIYDQIMAVDNFLAFKKLMIRRNTELNNEALQMSNALSASAQDIPSAIPEAIPVKLRPGEAVKDGELSLDDQLQQQIQIAEEMSRQEMSQIEIDEEEMLQKVLKESEEEFKRSETQKTQEDQQDTKLIQEQQYKDELIKLKEEQTKKDQINQRLLAEKEQEIQRLKLLEIQMQNQAAQQTIAEIEKQEIEEKKAIIEKSIPIIENKAIVENCIPIIENKAIVETNIVQKTNIETNIEKKVVIENKEVQKEKIKKEKVKKEKIPDVKQEIQLEKKVQKIYDLPPVSNTKKQSNGLDFMKEQYDQIKKQATFDPVADQIALDQKKMAKQEETKHSEQSSLSDFLREKSGTTTTGLFTQESTEDRTKRLKEQRAKILEAKKEKRAGQLEQFNDDKGKDTLLDHLKKIDQSVKDKQANPTVQENISPDKDKRKSYMNQIKKEFYNDQEEQKATDTAKRLEELKIKSEQIDAQKRLVKKQEATKTNEEREKDNQRSNQNQKLMSGIQSVNFDDDF